MIPDRMRNPLDLNVHADIPAHSRSMEQVWEFLGTVVADRRTSPSAVSLAVFAFPIRGRRTKNNPFSFVDKTFAEKNGKVGSNHPYPSIIANALGWESFNTEKPINGSVSIT